MPQYQFINIKLLLPICLSDFQNLQPTLLLSEKSFHDYMQIFNTHYTKYVVHDLSNARKQNAVHVNSSNTYINIMFVSKETVYLTNKKRSDLQCNLLTQIISKKIM